MLPMMISSTCGKCIGFGTLYDCTQTVRFGIYGYPTLLKCSHDMFSSQATVKLYKTQVYQYSPNVTKFAICSCSYTVVKLTCDYEFFFAGKRKSKEKIPQRLTVQECHQLINNFTATSNDAALIVRLFPVCAKFRRSHVDLSYSYTLVLVITKIQGQVRIHKFIGRIIGDLRIIEQHLARTQCSFFINSSTGLGLRIPGEDRNKIIIWVDPNHNETEMPSYDIYKTA